jgi:hypothetical protein
MCGTILIHQMLYSLGFLVFPQASKEQRANYHAAFKFGVKSRSFESEEEEVRLYVQKLRPILLGYSTIITIVNRAFVD